jgi:hypothetical protein
MPCGRPLPSSGGESTTQEAEAPRDSPAADGGDTVAAACFRLAFFLSDALLPPPLPAALAFEASGVSSSEDELPG